ncbi:MAG: fibronectin type III domain-containing protein, partial [bacterium]|nr:fibronectin type III domain-containing protein [bacterium]
SSTGTYRRLTGEVADSLITTGRTTFVDSTLDLSVSRVYFYRINTISLLRQSSALSSFVSAEATEDNRPPAAPSGLSVVTDVNTGFVVLTWIAPQADAGNQALTGLQGYKIFRAKDRQDAFVQIAIMSANQTTFTDSSALELDAQYYYQISAMDGTLNESGRSVSVSITTTGTGISAPSGLSTTGKIGEIEVLWNAISDPSLLGYLVLRSISTQTAFVPVTADTLFTTAQTRYLDANVVPGTIYFYRVQAVVQDAQRGLVRSDASAFVDGEAQLDQRAPGAPSDLIATLNEQQVGVVSLSWTAPVADSDGAELTGLAKFRVFRSRETATSFVLLAEIESSQTTYQDTTVDPLTRYYYTVSAVDLSGNVGPRSTSVTLVTRGLIAPRNLAAAAGPQKSTLTWTANTESELTGYEVLRFSSPTQAEPDIRFQTALTTYVDTPLVAGQTYIYRVRAVGVSGLQSDASAFVSATPQALVALLAAPRSVTARADIRQITVSWTANTEPELTG